MSAGSPDSVADHHYFDREFSVQAVKLLPGEFFVTDQPMLLTTVLGSCVAACVRDGVAGIGGMNHFMLPDERDGPLRDPCEAMRYGAFAMEVLLNELIKAGDRRERLEAKVFGGGAVLANMTQLNIGQRNADFVLRYLGTEQVRVLGRDLLGEHPRRVNFFPVTGRAVARKLYKSAETVSVQHDEAALAQLLARRRERQAVVMFGAPSTAATFAVSARTPLAKSAWAL